MGDWQRGRLRQFAKLKTAARWSRGSNPLSPAIRNDMSDATKNYIDYIEDHLKAAFDNAQMLEKYLEETEGDSDLFRKVSFYLVPSLNHWLVGAQAGNIKDLRDALLGVRKK